MSVPKKKLSKRRTRARRSHHGATVVGTLPSPIAGDDNMIRPHHSYEHDGKVYTWKELKSMMGKKAAGAAAESAAKGAKETKKAEAATKKPAAKKATEKKKD